MSNPQNDTRKNRRHPMPNIPWQLAVRGAGSGEIRSKRRIRDKKHEQRGSVVTLFLGGTNSVCVFFSLSLPPPPPPPLDIELIFCVGLFARGLDGIKLSTDCYLFQDPCK